MSRDQFQKLCNAFYATQIAPEEDLSSGRKSASKPFSYAIKGLKSTNNANALQDKQTLVANAARHPDMPKGTTVQHTL